MKKQILSGVQPTGNLHLGNYLGAIKQWVSLQDAYECLFCIVDLHAITVPQNPAELLNNTRETAAAYIACGINPEKNIIFNQSMVSGHSELAWILSCHTPLGWLNRMTQFKEKTKIFEANQKSKIVQRNVKKIASFFEGKEQPIDVSIELINLLNQIESEGEISVEANLGLYAYPVLMAADILLYKATHVPVGEDQKQHLELARDIAGAFNRAYPHQPDFFPLPEPLILGEATRVMSLRDGKKKMSKSDESDYSRINLTDDAETIRKKIQKATSDPHIGITYDVEKRPETSNLLTIYSALANIPRKQAEEKFATSNFSTFKKELADVAISALEPITSEMNRLKSDKAYLDTILKSGAEKAAAIAEENLNQVKDLVGFLRF